MAQSGPLKDFPLISRIFIPIIMKMKLPVVLKKILDERNLTISKLATMSDVPKTNIKNWIDGSRSSPNLEQVKKVAVVLGVSVHYLCWGSEDENSPLSKIMKDDLFSGTFEVTLKRIKWEGQ